MPSAQAYALRLPQMAPVSDRDHPLGNTTGWVYLVARDSALQLNRWTMGLGEAAFRVHENARSTPASEDGVWGPFPDPEDRDIRWRLRLDGVEHIVEAAPPSQDDWHVVVRWSAEAVEGHALIDPAEVGRFRFEFDGFAAVPDLGKWVGDVVRAYSGAIEIDFVRGGAVAELDVRFDDFEAWDVMPARTFSSQETWSYAQDASGAGALHAAVWDAFDLLPFTGPEIDRMQIDLAWDAADSGRASGTVAMGDLQAAGPLELAECFDAAGVLTWRVVGGEFATLLPDYAFGDESECALSDPRP
jgi:hypothetical protein